MVGCGLLFVGVACLAGCGLLLGCGLLTGLRWSGSLHCTTCVFPFKFSKA